MPNESVSMSNVWVQEFWIQLLGMTSREQKFPLEIESSNRIKKRICMGSGH